MASRSSGSRSKSHSPPSEPARLLVLEAGSWSSREAEGSDLGVLRSVQWSVAEDHLPPYPGDDDCPLPGVSWPAHLFERQVDLDTGQAFDDPDPLHRAGKQRGAHVGGWTLVATTGPVLRSGEEDVCQAALQLYALPELKTLHNTLALVHRASGLALVFTGYDALNLVARDHSNVPKPNLQRTGESLMPQGSTGLSPRTSALSSRTSGKSPRGPAVPSASGRARGPEVAGPAAPPSPPSPATGKPLLGDQEPPLLSPGVPSYDWTFSSPYLVTVLLPSGGTGSGGGPAGSSARPAIVSPSVERLDFGLLRQQDTIQFFSDTILFEDECFDCGISQLRVRVRVMPTFWFVLAQVFVRLDRTLVWITATRLLHIFGSDKVVGLTNRRAATFSSLVKSRPHLVRLLHTRPEGVLAQIPLVSRTSWHLSLPGTRKPSEPSTLSLPAVQSLRSWVPFARPAEPDESGSSGPAPTTPAAAGGPTRFLLALSPHPALSSRW